MKKDGKGKILVRRWMSPAGELLLGSYGEELCICDWVEARHRLSTDRKIQKVLNAGYVSADSEIVEDAIRQLEEYFVGERGDFDIPLLFTGTDFQCRVWKELMRIPYGETVPYSLLALRIGNPKATRAVAMANALNPISIFVPCHRVIGRDRSLTGYGGGLRAKQVLLDIEDRWRII